MRMRAHRLPRRFDFDGSTLGGTTVAVKRCGGPCARVLPAEVFTEEDGTEKCPECVDYWTAARKAETASRESRYAASRTPKPQLSRRPLRETFAGVITGMTDSNGTRVVQSAPLRLARDVAKALVLKGIGFAATDTVSGSTGLTVNVTARTSTQTDLSITAALSMAAGDDYGLTFNSSVYRNIFSVR